MRRIHYVEIPFSRYEETFIRHLRRGRFQCPGDVNFDLKSTSNRRLQLTFFRSLFDVSVLVGLFLTKKKFFAVYQKYLSFNLYLVVWGTFTKKKKKKKLLQNKPSRDEPCLPRYNTSSMVVSADARNMAAFTQFISSAMRTFWPWLCCTCFFVVVFSLKPWQ